MAKAIKLVPVDKEYRGLLSTFKKMDEIAKKDMQEIARKLAERGGNYARVAASNTPFNSKQAMAVAESIKISKSDKAPSFSVGGKQEVGSSAFSAGYVIMGNEFGSKRYKQFPRRSGRGGKEGWWLFKSMATFHPTISREWLAGFELIRNAWKERI